jgi:hypothetical protein
MGHLLDHGITPKYVIVCDANVDFDTYMVKWKDKLQDTILLMNVCGNTKWTFEGNWKDVYFFVNKDAIHSEVEFSKISGCKNFIPAGTNVSNAMVIMLTQCDNEGRRNFFGYDKILLIGYDYSWRPSGKYYAFDKTGGGKTHYMRHVHLVNNAGSYAYTSGNLSFSCRWLQKYIKTFNLPVVQCSKETILSAAKFGELEKQMQYRYKPEDSGIVRLAGQKRAQLLSEIKKLEHQITGIGKDHWMAHFCTT